MCCSVDLVQGTPCVSVRLERRRVAGLEGLDPLTQDRWTARTRYGRWTSMELVRLSVGNRIMDHHGWPPPRSLWRCCGCMVRLTNQVRYTAPMAIHWPGRPVAVTVTVAGCMRKAASCAGIALCGAFFHDRGSEPERSRLLAAMGAVGRCGVAAMVRRVQAKWTRHCKADSAAMQQSTASCSSAWHAFRRTSSLASRAQENGSLLLSRELTVAWNAA